MTDQHQSLNSPHQHNPYPPASPQYPQQSAGPLGQQPMPPAGMPGSASSTASSSKRPVVIAVVVALVALVMVFGGIIAYNTFFNSDMLMCGMRDGSGTAVDADLIWQMTQIPEGEEAGALVLIGQLTEHMTGLQAACADPGSPPK